MSTLKIGQLLCTAERQSRSRYKQTHAVLGNQSGQMNEANFIKRDCVRAVFVLLAAALWMPAQAPPPATSSGPILSFTATTVNVGGAPDSIRIDLLRWSTDAERDKLMSAWNMTGGAGRGGADAAGRGAGGRGAAAGRGGRGGRGGGAAGAVPDPDTVDGGGGRGRGGPARAEAPPRPTPEGTLAAALKDAPTVGYLWSSEVVGYALRYAGKVSGPDGLDRIILITDRHLGGTNDLWKPVGSGAPSAYDFSVIELRVNAKGEGEGKASLLGKVAPDSAAKIVALEDYAGQPVVFKNLKQRAR
jgi:hypothetical protein